MRKRSATILFISCLLALAEAWPQSADDLFQQARTLELVAGDLPGAIEIYEQIASAGTGSEAEALALLELGRLYADRGENQRAAEVLGRIVAAYSEHAYVTERARNQLAEITRIRIEVPFTKDYISFAISPDGTRLVYSVLGSGSGNLWLYHLTTGERHPIAGATLVDPIYTAHVWPTALPFWSPDSQSIGYFSAGTLKVISADGGTPRTLATARNTRGGSWSTTGTIVFAASPETFLPSDIYLVPADGTGPVESLGIADSACPQFLPDGRRFIVFQLNAPIVQVGSIDGAELTSIEMRAARVAPYAPDRLVFVDGAHLFEQRFDPASLAPTSTPTLVAEGISGIPGGNCHRGVSVSPSGPIAIQNVRRAVSVRVLARYNRLGEQVELVARDPRGFCCVRLSADGSHVLVGRNGSVEGDLWTIDLEAPGREERIVAGTRYGVWTPRDDLLIAGIYNEQGPQGPDYYLELITLGDFARRRLLPARGSQPVDVSRDGRFILYEDRPKRDLLALPVDLATAPDSTMLVSETQDAIAAAVPIPVATSTAIEQRGRFSPDSEWIAFQSNEIGDRHEILIRRLGGDPQRSLRVSRDGGTAPVWRADGRELFFISPEFELMSVAIEPGDNGRIEIGEPTALFRLPTGAEFDVFPDGETFLVNYDEDFEQGMDITVLMNPFE